MADAAAGSLGEVGVDVYGDLARLDRDLSEARRKVEAFARDMSAKVGGAMARANGTGGMLPQRELDNFTRTMDRMLGDVTRRAGAQIADLERKTSDASRRVAEDVAKVGKATDAASKQAGSGVSGLNREVQQLNSSITRLGQNAARSATTARGGGAAGVARTEAASARADQRAAEQLVRAYYPLHAAQLDHLKDLEKIDRLERAGILTRREATVYVDKSTEAFRRAQQEQSKAYQLGVKASEQIKQYSGLLLIAAGITGVALVQNSLNNAKAIKATAEEVGVSVEAWQEYGYIANQVGVSNGELQQGFAALQRAVGRASAGAVRESKLFKALGVEIVDAGGKAKSQDKILRELADALERVGNENERAAARQILFGQSADEMKKILAGGSQKIDELAAAARNLGVVLSAREIQEADRTAQKLEDVKTVLSAQISGVVAANAQSIVALAGALGELTGQIVRFLGSNPAMAVALIGALAGGRIAGARGAVIGGVAGLAIGSTAPRVGQAINSIDVNREARYREGLAGRYLDRRTDLSPEARAAAKRLARQQTRARLGITDEAGPLGTTKTTVDFDKAAAEMARRPRAAGAAAPAGGNIDLSGLLAPKPPKGRSGREKSNNGALRGDKALTDEELNLQAQILQIMRGNSDTAAARAAIDLQLLEIDRKKFEANAKLQVATGRWTQAEGKLIVEKYGELERAKRQEILDQQAETQRQEALSIAQASTQSQSETLSAQKALSRTTAERREIELKLLDLQVDLAKKQEEAVIASTESSKVEKDIAAERLRHLDELKQLQRKIILRETQGPVADFFDSIPRTATEINEAIERIRAANLEDLRNRAVSFADDVGEAFGNLGRDILNLESPFKILQNFITSLANTFNEEVLIRPMQDWARRKIGGPLAEKVVGAPAGAEGLSMKTLEASSLQAALKLDQLQLSAQMAAQSLQMVSGGSLTDIDAGIAEADRQINQFANDLPNVIQQILASAPAAGGGGGWLGTLFKLGASAIGGGGVNIGAATSGAMSVVDAGIKNFKLPGYANGTDSARGGWSWVGERGRELMFVPPRSKIVANHRLSSIAPPRMPEMPAFDIGARSQPGNRNVSVSYGDVHFHGAVDERMARRSTKQMSAQIQRDVSTAVKQGFRRD